MPFGNAVAVTADQRAEIRAVSQITIQCIVAQHDVAEIAVFVRYFERLHDAAISHDARLHAVGIAQRVNFHRRPVQVLPNGSPAIGELALLMQQHFFVAQPARAKPATSNATVRVVLINNFIFMDVFSGDEFLVGWKAAFEFRGNDFR